MNQVSAGADVDTSVGGLHAREVELGAWGGERLVKGLQLHELLHPLGQEQGWLMGQRGWLVCKYLDAAVERHWARAAHPHGTSRSSVVGFH